MEGAAPFVAARCYHPSHFSFRFALSGVLVVKLIRMAACVSLLVSGLAMAQAVAQYDEPYFDTPPDMPEFTALPSQPSIGPLLETPSTVVPTPEIAPPSRPMPPLVRTAAPAPRRAAGLSAASTSQLPKQVQNVIDFYGGATSARALSQLPYRPSSGVPRPPTARIERKPFQGHVRGAPLSPYLNLFIDNDVSELPNYHAFVRPLQQQQASAATQQREIMQLDKQVRRASYNANGSGGAATPVTGHGTRYLNTAQFYPSTRKTR